MEKIKNNISKIIIVILVLVIAIVSYSFYDFSQTSEKKFVESENLRILKLEEENNLRSELDDIIEKYDNSRDEVDHLNLDLISFAFSSINRNKASTHHRRMF